MSRTPIVNEVFSDNGEHSHWNLIDPETGENLWSEDPEEDEARKHPVKVPDYLVKCECGCLAPDKFTVNDKGGGRVCMPCHLELMEDDEYMGRKLPLPQAGLPDEMSDEHIEAMAIKKWPEMISPIDNRDMSVTLRKEYIKHIKEFRDLIRDLANKQMEKERNDNEVLRSLYKGAIDDLEWERNNKKQLHEDEMIAFAEWLTENYTCFDMYPNGVWMHNTDLLKHKKLATPYTTQQLLIKYRESCK